MFNVYFNCVMLIKQIIERCIRFASEMEANTHRFVLFCQKTEKKIVFRWLLLKADLGGGVGRLEEVESMRVGQ